MMIFVTPVCYFGCLYSPSKKNVGFHILFSSTNEVLILNFSTMFYVVLLHGAIDVGCPSKFW